MEATTDTPQVRGDFPGEQRVHFAATQREAVIAELRDARQSEREHMAGVRSGLKGSSIPAARERMVALDRVLAQVESTVRPGRPFALVGPAWLIRAIVFGAGDYAVYLLGQAVSALNDGTGSRRQVRERFAVARTWTGTMLAVTRGEGGNHG